MPFGTATCRTKKKANTAAAEISARANAHQSPSPAEATASSGTAAKPTGYTIRFGMMYSSRSIAVMATSAAASKRYAGSAHNESANRIPTAAHSTAVPASIAG